jgi:hypothetical protein
VKIVVPVSAFEFKKPLNVLGFIKSLRHFGCYPNHELIVVVRPSEKLFGKAVYDLIEDLFDKKTFHVFPTDGTLGWPQGPNSYWKQTIEYFKETDNKDPWFWMELDTIPLKPKWADILEDAYKKQDKKCFGTVQDTTTVTSDEYLIIIAKHLQGTAVYPARVDKICSIWEYVDRLDKAFDVITQWEIMPHTQDTKLIQQGFRTINYKFTKDPFQIKGEDNGDMNGVVTYDQPIDPEAVLHHGCKDTSLADIVTSEDYRKLFL